MNRNVSPPLIILLDMLFIFLFILVLNNDSIINIEIPKDRLPDSSSVVYLNGDRYINVSNEEPLTHNSALIKCNFLIECRKAISKHKGKEVYVVLSSETTREISEISFAALETESCKRLNFKITNDGNIDIDSLLDTNSCLSKISGLYKKYKKI